MENRNRDRLMRRIPPRHDERQSRPVLRRMPPEMTRHQRKEYVDDLQQGEINSLFEQMADISSKIETIARAVNDTHHAQMAVIQDVKKQEDAFLNDNAINKFETILADTFENIKILEKTDTKEDLGKLTDDFFENLRTGKRATALKIAEDIIPRYDEVRELYIKLWKGMSDYSSLLKDNFRRARDLREITEPRIEELAKGVEAQISKSMKTVQDFYMPDRNNLSEEQRLLLEQQKETMASIQAANENIKKLMVDMQKAETDTITQIAKDYSETMRKNLEQQIKDALLKMERKQQAEDRQEVQKLREMLEEVRSSKFEAAPATTPTQIQPMQSNIVSQRQYQKVAGPLIRSHEELKKTIGHYDDEEDEDGKIR